ncbi:hypothetical protein [Duganella sp. FT27W]|uniref:hypothetical protein n=1 Tax=Duganella sp. FT27W TaxID=2654636 RepID=UPI00128D0E89|nr:hypothetical protein [Duganella sp. FT27W]MPQ56833.1 hypothetical protein [Duganella sp. FT27W]
MPFANDLLNQAGHLAFVDHGKPRQANLRRAVSSAYYAVFHLLADEGAALMGSRLNQLARTRIQRAFTHADMKSVCSQYAKGSHSRSVHAQIAPLLSFPVEDELMHLAFTFVELQEYRHAADYDLSRKFYRIDVLAIINAASAAFEDWRVAKPTNNAKIFLVDLMLRKSWSRI